MNTRDQPRQSATLESESDQLVTRTGFRFDVRRVAERDTAALAEFFRQVTPEDLRFRFLTAINEVSHARLLDLIRVDQQRTESFLVTPAGEDEPVLAAAMLAADAAGERGEVAISIRADHKGRGIGWTLLDHLARRARNKGIQVLEAIESRENRDAITIEREMGFTAEAVEGDPTIVVLRRQLA